MLSGAAALHQPAPARHRSLAWLSADGQTWTEPVQIGHDNLWLWRMTWHKGVAYSMAYSTSDDHFVRLYGSKDGESYDIIADRLQTQSLPNEASLIFLPDDSALCLLRRETETQNALLGAARPPYTVWDWKDLGRRVGGPHFIALPDGTFIAAVRMYEGIQRTALCWLDTRRGILAESLMLPSRGDSSYCGLVWHEGLLWVSYYSSHEGKTSIYLARVEVS